MRGIHEATIILVFCSQSGMGAEELVSYRYVHSSHLYLLSSKEKVVDHATPDFYKR